MKKYDWKEYDLIVKPILENPEFIKRKTYAHHNDISVYDHCLAVSKLSYQIAKKAHLDYKSAAIAGLLHDFYFQDWQINKEKKPILKRHGFVHAREAMINSYRHFPDLMNEKIANSILRHMFPLNKIPPKYKIGWIITLADKYVSMEVFKHPGKLPELVGLKKKKGK